jgi:tRNA/tmRNA/rRNA uracil-C5-methylase (TrmA/RlmC/RlmD family)
MELRTGGPAAGGGCVARADDGRVVFVRHSLPGERVIAEVTAETSSFLRADAVEVLEASAGRVAPPCPHAGPGGCGGCDYQHVAPAVQRELKASLVAEQLRRLAGDDREVVVEAVAGDRDGLAWRTRVRFAVDRSGQVGLHAHRSHRVVPVEHCAIATPSVDAVGVGAHRWAGATEVEVVTSGRDGTAVVSVRTGRRQRLGDRPRLDAGRVVDGRTEREPHRLAMEVLGHRYDVSVGVFWQVHPGAPATLVRAVLDGLGPVSGDRVADLFAGAGLFTVPLAAAVGPTGSVTAVERSRRACADAVGNCRGLGQVTVIRADVDADRVASGIGTPDLVVLDPAREGAGRPVMEALAALRPAPRRVVYVACDPASFARDLRVLTDVGWTMPGLRALDLFPMTEHVELVAVLVPPTGR